MRLRLFDAEPTLRDQDTGGDDADQRARVLDLPERPLRRPHALPVRARGLRAGPRLRSRATQPLPLPLHHLRAWAAHVERRGGRQERPPPLRGRGFPYLPQPGEYLRGGPRRPLGVHLGGVRRHPRERRARAGRTHRFLPRLPLALERAARQDGRGDALPHLKP